MTASHIRILRIPYILMTTKMLSQGVPQRIIRDNQAFQLVAFIEGAAANTQFINNLQVLGQQRRMLLEVRQKLSSLTKSATAEERAALQSQLNQIDARVTLNMQFMTKNYGYSVQHNYLLSPVNSALLKKAVDESGKPIDNEAQATLVAEFQTAESYDQLQALRQRAGQLGGDESKKAEFEIVKKELKDTYAFEVGCHYVLQVRKGALYATVA